MTKKKLIIFLIITIYILNILILLFLSPYKYEWDEEIKQINNDTIDVLKGIYFTFLIIISLLIIFIKNALHLYWKILLFILLGYIIYKLSELILIGW